MKKSIVSNLLVGFSILLLLGGTAWADLYYHVSIDVSSISGMDFELEAQLWDINFTIGDSWTLIDNVVFGAELVDFEDATLQGFDNLLNPASVDVVPGSITSGSYVLQMVEDPVFWPTITFRSFVGAPVNTLQFDFEFVGDAAGQDQLVFYILDPVAGGPFVSLPGLYGFGDVLEATASGVTGSSEVTAELVPVPPALLLGMIGIGTVGIFRRFRKSV